MRGLCCLFVLWLLVSCHYDVPRPASDCPPAVRDSLEHLMRHHYTCGYNLELHADSVQIACLPLKGKYFTLHHGDRVVVAEFAVHPKDTVDSVWVKLAHTQEVQGWMRECDMKRQFVPTDGLSQSIYFFSHTHAAWFIGVLALFVVVWLLRTFRREQLRMVYINDVDSVYPLMLCLVVSCSAVLYASMQQFVPDTWEHFYFNPTLSPFRVPLVLSLFLLSLWAFVILLLAACDVVFRRLPPATAVCYLLGLASVCVFCYFFFMFTTTLYVGYAFLLAFAWLCFRRLRQSLRASRYSCGQCGMAMRAKGRCPHCGAMNV